jgi:hypothetical protein
MAKLLSSGDDIGYTIVPYNLVISLNVFSANPSDYLLGYVTYNKERDEHRFTYTESGGLTEAKDHWSLSILKEFPNCEKEYSWLVYSSLPEKAQAEFNHILGSGETLRIGNWDTWSVKGKNAKVAVVTSWEIF